MPNQSELRPRSQFEVVIRQSPRMSIDCALLVENVSDQGNAVSVCDFNGFTGWDRSGGDDWNSRPRGFDGNVCRDPTTDTQNERSAVVSLIDSPPDNFVNGILPTNIAGNRA